MAYHVEPNGDIVIDSFDKGIGASPYSGLTDLKSVNIDGVPAEASVNFATESVIFTSSVSNGTLATDINGNLHYQTVGGHFLENGQAIYISSGSSISGLSSGTPVYYIESSSNQGGGLELLSVSKFYGTQGTLVSLGTTGTATFSTYNVALPKFFQTSGGSGASTIYWMIDSLGQVWSNKYLTAGGTGITSTASWAYTGNAANSGPSPDATANGNGMVYWRTANSTKAGDWDGWLFIFRNGAIDYCNVNGINNGALYDNSGNYVYGWNPATGGIGASSYLTGTALNDCPHNAIVGTDGRVYFCDYYNIRKITQTDLVTPTSVNLGSTGTYTYNTYNLLPINDIATCIAPLGTNMLIGGTMNQGYQWDTVSNLITNPILLAESYVANIVTVNTNAFMFIGNRGNIYVTNGSQANVYKKVPDHISLTTEPYFQWGGATYNKGRLFFGVNVIDNNSQVITGYGGVWAIDLDTGAIWLANQLSYGSYSGYASALFPTPPQFQASFFPVESPGPGFLAGWYDGVSSYGIDWTNTSAVSAASTGIPYTGGQSYIVSDMIPVGTLLKPTTSSQVEFKVSKPLLVGETVELQVASTLGTAGTFTSALTTTGDATGTIVSGNSQGFPIQQNQWLLVKAIMTAKSTNPSFNRITQLRVIGGIPQNG